MEPLRIQLYLARLGLGSRREIEEWIREGKVSVNGKPARLGQKIDPAADQIKCRRKLIRKQSSAPIVVALHKPRQVISSVKDPEGRRTVVDLVPIRARLFPVGRLDFNSEGLILLTNDGELAYRLTHPKFEVSKVYEVHVRGSLDDKKLDAIKRGLRLGDEKLKPAQVLSVHDATRTGVQKSLVRLRIWEGKNQQVRRMFEAVGCRVIGLKRLSIGNLDLKGLGRSQYRLLSSGQIQILRKAVGL